MSAPAAKIDSARDSAAAGRALPGQAGQAIRRTRYTETVSCGCGTAFQRARGAAHGACLGYEMARAQAVAGIGADDPGLLQWAGWNAGVGAGAARGAVR